MKEKLVMRAAPRWAWDTIEETLRLDAESSAFDPQLRRDIRKALSAVQDVDQVDAKPVTSRRKLATTQAAGI